MPGSTRKFTIEGISYLVAADSNLTHLLARVKNEGIPTSGKTQIKKTFVVPQADVDLIVTPSEAESIKSTIEGLSTVKVSYTDMEGNVYRCVGQVSAENYERQENKLKVTVIPEDTWTLFPA